VQSALLSFLSLAALVYIGLGVLLYVSQRSMLYQPTPEMRGAPDQKMVIASDGESLNVWRLNAGRPRAIIYFGGNAENVYGNVTMFERAFADTSVYLVNYRGYGGSTGSPSERGLYVDAVSIFDRLETEHTQIAVIGRSLGSGVATYLASVRNVDRMVLITPFDSIERVASQLFPIFPISLLLKDPYRSIERVGAIDAPTLVIVAERDEVIPRRHSDALIAAFGDRKPQVVTIRGAMHNTIDVSTQYSALLEEFL
jgi:pimeloyl-ACP methyl ester carboxylesterase